MDINLLSQNLIILLSVSAASATTFILVNTNKKWLGKWLGKKSIILLSASIIATAIIELVIHHFFPSDKLPDLMWLMILPFPLSVSLVVLSWHSKISWLKWLAISNSIICLLITLVLINAYYGFFPTLSSIFNANSRDLTNGTQTTILQFASVNRDKTNTIESNLYSQDSTTNGKIEKLKIPGSVSNFSPRDEWAYIPAIASSSSNVNLPVLILLPGFPGATGNWLGSTALRQTMDEFAKQHHGIAPIVFMVDNTGSLTNDTECVDSPRGNVETYLTKDVPSYIKIHYKVATSPSNWAIGGLSMGGMCSAMIALRHPDVYHYFLDFGGENGPEVGSYSKTVADIFGGSQKNWQSHQILQLLKKHKYRDMGAFFAVGQGDSKDLINGIKQAYADSQKAGIESFYEKVAGEHTFKVWQQSFKIALPWLSNRLGATDCVNSCGL